MGCSGPQTSSATQGIGILLSTPHTHLCERTAAVDGAGWCLNACSPIKAGFSSRHALAAELSAAGGTTASCSWLSSCPMGCPMGSHSGLAACEPRGRDSVSTDLNKA